MELTLVIDASGETFAAHTLDELAERLRNVSDWLEAGQPCGQIRDRLSREPIGEYVLAPARGETADHDHPYLIEIYCAHCGGTDVRRDAWAVWDAERQVWTLGEVFDAGYCADCDGETRLEERDLAP